MSDSSKSISCASYSRLAVNVFTNAHNSSWSRVYTAFLCLSVFPHDISNLTGMFYRESWKPIYFGVKGSKHQGHEPQKTLPAWVFALL